ncbi:MAG: PDR/VanB family oxidoreductase [Aquisalimonadaceae bacterium]
MARIGEKLDVRVEAISVEAESIKSYDLRPVTVDELPPFQAGAHINVHLGNGLTRSYSLLNSQSERHRYVIGVNLDAKSRGGSSYMHASVGVGDVLEITPPRNNFPLIETAEHSVFIAGGIGVTPMLAMVQRLHDLGRSWQLIYCARSRRHAAFVDRLAELGPEAQANILLHFDEDQNGRALAMNNLIAGIGPGPQYYCCGPGSMLAAFKEATTSQPPDHVHVEYFAGSEAPSSEGGFTVVLARSGDRVDVPPGSTIIEALQAAGVVVPTVCLQGVCGTCETAVLAGIPDHRDLILSKDERDSNKTMMICCSGSFSDELVLDL